MKVNAISSFNYNSNRPSFKHTAVPYPEYENAYYNTPDSLETKIIGLANKISDLFSPKVTKEAAEIKSGIDTVYSKQTDKKAKIAAQKQLLSVLA